MTRIEGSGSIYTPMPLRRVQRTGGPGGASFSSHLDSTSETELSSAAQDMTPLGTVAGVLGIQEVDDAASRASRGKKRAQEMLDKLEALRLALLTGAVSKDMLMQLARFIHAKRIEVSDPQLAAILDEIDLRAQVELAKFDLPA